MVDYTKAGMDKIVEILGKDHAQKAIQHFEGLAPEFSQFLVNYVYGVVATNSKLDGKTRELAIVCNIMGQGSSKFALGTHLKSMLNEGWKKEEIIQMVIELTQYNGFPRCIETLEVFKKICDDMSI
jgi:4-carboxymuconolactone decarboxylase